MAFAWTGALFLAAAGPMAAVEPKHPIPEIKAALDRMYLKKLLRKYEML